MFYSVDTQDIASIVVRVGDPGDIPASDDTGFFAFDPLIAVADDYQTKVTTTIHSSFTTAQPYVRVVVLARAPGGQIIDVDSMWVDDVPTGASPVDAVFYLPHPDGTTYEAFASR